MAFCIQNGIPFLGNEVVKADVLYADFELRPNAIKNRFDMLKEHYNMPDAERFKVMSLASKEFSLDGSTVRKILRGCGKQTKGYTIKYKN